MGQRLRQTPEIFTPAFNAWLRGLTKALDRVGESRRDQLRWLLGFAERDPLTVREEDWRDLQDDLYALPIKFGYIPPSSGSADDPSPPRLGDEQIRALQQEVRSGIRRFQRGVGWRFTVDRLTRHAFRATHRSNRTTIEGDLRSCVLMATADLLEAEGRYLRACPECKRLFVAVKRQAYCGRQCSQRARTRRFRVTRREELSERQRRSYEKRKKAELGEKVRVQRRKR